MSGATGAREVLIEVQMDCHILPLRIRILAALQMRYVQGFAQYLCSKVPLQAGAEP
jgi:hypothetical protein